MMTPEEQTKMLTNMERMSSSLEKMQRGQDVLHEVLIGDKVRGKVGVLDLIELHRKEIFGDRDTQHIGLKESTEKNGNRISSLEGDRVKMIAIATAVSSLVGIGWILVKQFVLK